MGHPTSDFGASGKVRSRKQTRAVPGPGSARLNVERTHAKSNRGASEQDKLNLCFLVEQDPDSQTLSHCCSQVFQLQFSRISLC